MAQVLCISSFVARGHVGLSAIVPALQGLGHETIELPSVLLSNHPGHRAYSKRDMPPEAMTGMIAIYEQAGWLRGIDAVLTGYLPSAGHVDAAANAIDRVRKANPKALYVCDPVLGDDPHGLYIAQEAAEALRDRLVPLANCITPNRFELAWLSGLEVNNAAQAIEASRTLMRPMVLATSIPGGPAHLSNILVQGDDVAQYVVPRFDAVPHGSGDFMGALFTGHLLDDCTANRALNRAAAAVHAVAARSQGRDELVIVPDSDVWKTLTPPATKQ